MLSTDQHIATTRRSITSAATALLGSLTLEERKVLSAELSYLAVGVAELNGKL
jgi:hypothetical protein